MSLENARRFIETAAKDQALQQKLAAAREPAEAVRLAVQAGSERGLPFTAEELQASLGPQRGQGGGELSDDQLGSVAGGVMPRVTVGAIQELLSRYFQPETPSPQDVSLSHEPLHGRS